MRGLAFPAFRHPIPSMKLHSVFCISKTRSQADHVVESLKESKFSKHGISVLLLDKGSTGEFALSNDSKTAGNALSSAVAGGLVGGSLGWIAGFGAVTIPGVGSYIAAGPILAALSPPTVVAGLGEIVGGLVGLGIAENDAKRFDGKVKKGSILLSVHADNAADIRRAKEVFTRANAEDIGITGEVASTAHAKSSRATATGSSPEQIVAPLPIGSYPQLPILATPSQ